MGVPYGTGLKQSASSVMLHVAYMPINNSDEKYACYLMSVPQLFIFGGVGTLTSGV